MTRPIPTPGTTPTAAEYVAAEAIPAQGYALREQGLDILAELLGMVGEDFEVTSLGGNIMALRLTVADNSEWLITGDGGDDYTMARYEADAIDSEDSLPPVTLDTKCQRTDVMDLLRFRRTGTPFAA
jgi:hypothetical protein